MGSIFIREAPIQSLAIQSVDEVMVTQHTFSFVHWWSRIVQPHWSSLTIDLKIKKCAFSVIANSTYLSLTREAFAHVFKEEIKFSIVCLSKKLKRAQICSSRKLTQ